LKKAKPRHKAKKLTAQQQEAEAKMAKMLADAKESEADAAQIKAWENEVKPDVPMRVCGRTGLRVRSDQWEGHVSALSAEIMPYLYLGGERNAHNHKELTYRTHVGFVLNAAWEVPNFFRDQLEYLHLPFQDFADQAGAMAAALNRTLVFIDRARAYGSNVLVHCVAGISRSSTIVMHYLIRREGWTLKRAYQHVLKLRPIIRPNAGFFKELQRVERDVHGKVSMSFEEYMAMEEGQTKIGAFS
jgi:protein-tyrosine phosphatase